MRVDEVCAAEENESEGWVMKGDSSEDEHSWCDWDVVRRRRGQGGCVGGSRARARVNTTDTHKRE